MKTARLICLWLSLSCAQAAFAHTVLPREAVTADGLIYVSGIAGSGKGDIRAQTRQVLQRLAQVLQRNNSSLAQTASVFVCLQNANDFAAMNEVWQTFWPSDPPTRTTIIATGERAAALVQLSAIAIPRGSERNVIHPTGWQKNPNYSYGIKSGATLFLAGLVARDPTTGAEVSGDVTAQTRQVLTNAGALLQAAGMNYADVVSARVFIAAAAHFQTMNAAYRPFFQTAPPARATVQAQLPGSSYNVEITLLAVRSPDRQIINTDGDENLPYSSAVRVGRRLYVSGMIGSNGKNDGDIAAQTKQSLDWIGEALKAAGYDWRHVVDQLIYLTESKYVTGVNRTSRRVFGQHRSTRYIVKTPLVIVPPLVEIMLVAVR